VKPRHEVGGDTEEHGAVDQRAAVPPPADGLLKVHGSAAAAAAPVAGGGVAAAVAGARAAAAGYKRSRDAGPCTRYRGSLTQVRGAWQNYT